jgi:hypothetical protein
LLDVVVAAAVFRRCGWYVATTSPAFQIPLGAAKGIAGGPVQVVRRAVNGKIIDFDHTATPIQGGSVWLELLHNVHN